MIKDYLEIGKITSTHGIKGEMRVQPWCDSPEFMKKFKTLYLDKKGEKPLKVNCRPNGNMVIMKAMHEKIMTENISVRRNREVMQNVNICA